MSIINDKIVYEIESLKFVMHELSKIADLLEQVRQFIADPRDEYHTMRDLYEWRAALHAHAARAWLDAGWPVVKSWRHHDGEECFGGGWFIVVTLLPTGQVSNHYPADKWDLFSVVPEADRAPAWDGHTAEEALSRIVAALDRGDGAPDQTDCVKGCTLGSGHSGACVAPGDQDISPPGGPGTVRPRTNQRRI